MGKKGLLLERAYDEAHWFHLEDAMLVLHWDPNDRGTTRLG